MCQADIGCRIVELVFAKVILLNGIITIFTFILGLCVGSFLNVCIYRIPLGESVVYKPSHCPGCGEKLGAGDLVPLLSYLLLKGKCRHCGVKISPRYPLVELLTGIVFVLVFLFYRPESLLAVKYIFILSVLILVTFIDLDHRIIPNRLVMAILVWGLLWQIFQPEISWPSALGGALFGGGLLLLAALLSKGGMGGGDIKLMFAAGFVLGLPLTILATFLSFFSGGIAGLTLMLWKKVGGKHLIPFGPFLSFGIATAVLWGQEIIGWYLELITMCIR